MNAVLHALKGHPLFKSLWIVTLQKLAKNARLIELPKGRVVYHQGDMADAIYVVINGRLHATISDNHTVVEIYGPESTFGERALFTGDPHWTTVTVVTDARLIRLDVQSVQRAMQRSALLARELAARMGQHIRKVNMLTTTQHGSRIYALASVSSQVDMPSLTMEIADMLHFETGRSVLVLDVTHEKGDHSLESLRINPLSHTQITGWMDKSDPRHEAISRLNMHLGDIPSEASRVAPLLAHLSRTFERIIVLGDARRGSPAMLEFLLQCDASYLLTQWDDHQIHQVLHVRQLLSNQPDRGRHARINTIVCVKPGETVPANDTIFQMLGSQPHLILRDVPTLDNVEKWNASSLYHAQLRSFAREIGHCRVGLALSAGGARGLAHVGVIQVLEEHGIHIDVVAGTSMGALVAALWCAGKNGTQLEEIARRLERPRILFEMIDPIFPPRKGFMKGGFVKNLMQRELGSITFAELVKPLRVVATDIDTLERIVINHGEVWQAIQASTAIPAMIIPYHYLDRNLVDGGISDPLPVDVLHDMGIERVIAVNTIPSPEDIRACRISQSEQPPSTTAHKPRWISTALNRHVNYFAEGNVLDIIMKSVHGTGCRLAEHACQQADVVLKPILCDGTFHDFRHPGRYIETGRKTAIEHLDDIRTLSEPNQSRKNREEIHHAYESSHT